MVLRRCIKLTFIQRRIFNCWVLCLFLTIFWCKTHFLTQGRYQHMLFSMLEKKLLAKRFLGFRNFVADLYWLSLLQKDHTSNKLSADDIFSTADFITDLDPHFNVVYRFAAIGLMFNLKKPDFSYKLLVKALNSPFNNDDWRIYFLLGYNRYFFYHDVKKSRFYINVACCCSLDFFEILKSDRFKVPEYVLKWSEKLNCS